MSADRNLRRDLERAKEEKVEERWKRLEKVHGQRGFLKVDRNDIVVGMGEIEQITALDEEEEEEVEVNSVLD